MKRKWFFATLREQLFEALKEAIITNQYQPGEELQVEKLAAEFGVSSTPLREAMVRLAGLGLVELEPNRGARVPPITPEDICAVWEVRRLLEPYAARLTAHLCSLDEIDALEAQLTAVLEQPEDFTEYMDSDLALHALFQKHVTNKLLRNMLDQATQQSLRIRYFAESNPPTLQKEIVRQATLEHMAIIKALREGNAEETALALETHLRNAEKRALIGLERGNQQVQQR